MFSFFLSMVLRTRPKQAPSLSLSVPTFACLFTEALNKLERYIPSDDGLSVTDERRPLKLDNRLPDLLRPNKQNNNDVLNSLITSTFCLTHS